MSDSQSIIDDIIAVENRWVKAHRAMDLETIAYLMDDEYQKIDDCGALLDKAQTLATYKPEQRRWEEAASDQLEVKIFGDTALLTGRWRAKGVNRGHHFDYTARFVTVYIRRTDGWKLLFEQSTPVAP